MFQFNSIRIFDIKKTTLLNKHVISTILTRQAGNSYCLTRQYVP
jgi:hypothetical protein